MSPSDIQYWIINKDPEYDIIYTTRTNDIHGKMKSNENINKNINNFKIMTEKNIINLNDYEIDNLKNKNFISF